MTSMWDIFQSSGLVDSATQSWRERERAGRLKWRQKEKKEKGGRADRNASAHNL